MKLVPIRPPGPNARKARAFEADIRQLRAQRFTFEAIREALAAAGVEVSNSTVQREVARATNPRATADTTAASDLIKGGSVPSSLASAAPVEAPGASVSTPLPPDWHNGQDVAEAYTRNRISNPLIRAKEKR